MAGLRELWRQLDRVYDHGEIVKITPQFHIEGRAQCVRVGVHRMHIVRSVMWAVLRDQSMRAR